MQKYIPLSFSVILQTAVIIQGQSISPLTTPHPTQAVNSTVVITASVTPPPWVISLEGNWIANWTFGGILLAQAGYAPYPDLVSAVDSSIYSSQINVSAVAMSASNFTTQLTIAQIRADEDAYLIELSDGSSHSQAVVMIRYCQSSLPYDVIVDATSRIFNSPGKFACSNGGDLFYSNGTMMTSTDTTCLISAEWSGQYNLQCWTAPNVSISSSSIEDNKLTVIEGNDLNLTCNYNDVIPPGNISRFYIDGNSYARTQGEPFTLSSSQKSDNNKVVSCQAVTPYTDVHPTSGRSSEYALDVLYVSSSVTNKIETSQFVIESSESNYLLRSDQQLTMNCSPSDANPPANCSWQLCSDSRCQTLISDGGCLITVDHSVSINVTCTAENVVGSITSAEKIVDVIPAERQPQVDVTGSNVTNDGSINSTTYLGESIMISCSVSYENEMSTTYLIKLPNNTMISQSLKMFSSVTRDDSGDYICITSDQFGSFSAAIYLNVIYAATQDDKIPTCNWNLNEIGFCSVVFFSNPNSLFISLNKNGSSVASDGAMTIESTGDQDQQTFTFTRTQVINSDNGSYELTVKSSSSGLLLNSVLLFNIEVVDNMNDNGEPPGTPGLSTGAIAGIIAGFVVVILCAAGYGVYRWRRGSQKKDQPSYIDVDGNDSIQKNSDYQTNYEVAGPAEDENGYLAVNGSTTGHLRNRASNSQLEIGKLTYLQFLCVIQITA
ncbi:uncharacterized protein LOC143445017 [Clavelina lepadiformis]|uniref:uncharacterized protein LOC143445017 n=1 Tax=Clavelina lepadiformis TaxID=159417 RepID=UPI004041A953